jgi:hypothetical protein
MTLFFNNLISFIGKWIARYILHYWEQLDKKLAEQKGGKSRGKYYNHSTFCDLIISGLVGIKPSAKNKLIVKPLISDDIWDYFCLDYIKYHGHMITILWDKTGNKYKRGQGFQIYIDRKLKFLSNNIQNTIINLD